MGSERDGFLSGQSGAGEHADEEEAEESASLGERDGLAVGERGGPDDEHVFVRLESFQDLRGSRRR